MTCATRWGCTSCTRWGVTFDPRDYTQYPVQLGYGVHQAANYLLGHCRYADASQFWRTMTRATWAECPTSDIFPWILLKAARLVGRENVCLATSPTKCPESLAGKLDWIHKHMPPWMHRQYAITPRSSSLPALMPFCG